MTYKTPFLVHQHFLTPEECSKIISSTRVEPDVDLEGTALPMFRAHNESEDLIFEKFKPLVPHIEEHYGIEYKATETIQFQQYPVTSSKLAEQPHCDNAAYKRKKWTRISGRDLSCILWLKDFQDQPPFDLKKHVYGGKLEFPVYNFSFQPQAGTLVVFPSCERFIQATTSVLVGELQLAKFYVHSKNLWLYDPVNFPGDFRLWFTDVV